MRFAKTAQRNFFSLPFRVALLFVVVSMALSVVGIGYASFQRDDSEGAFLGGLSIALGFIAGGAVGLYLLVDFYLQKIVTLERQRLEAVEMLRAAEANQLRADGLAALAAGVAHDFNNLLQPLHLGLDLLAQQVEVRPEGRAIVARLQGYLDQADAVVRAVGMEPSGAGGADGQEVLAAGPLLEGFVNLVRPQLPAGVRLEPVIGADLPSFRGHTGQILKALHHVVDNAVEAMAGRAGTITLTATCQRRGERDWLCLAAEDEGPGFKPEVLAQAFTPFYTTKSRGRGTGMGLTVVRRILQAHGGDVVITSPPGRGANVTLSFPAA